MLASCKEDKGAAVKGGSAEDARAKSAATECKHLSSGWGVLTVLTVADSEILDSLSHSLCLLRHAAQGLRGGGAFPQSIQIPALF